MTAWNEMLLDGDYVGIAQALLSDLDHLDFSLLRDDPWAAIEEMPDVQIVIQEALPLGACGGGYYDRATSQIYVHPASHRRNNFTLLHELGHHIQQHHQDWAFVLMDDVHRLQRRKVEEKVSDQLVVEVLLRPMMTDELDPLVESPAIVMAGLHEISGASRSAALVHVASVLKDKAKWILAVADLEGKVQQASVTYDQFPPKRGMVQPGFARLAAEATEGLVRRNFTEGMVYQRGRELHEMKVEATLDYTGTYVFVALTPVERFGMGNLEFTWYLCGDNGCVIEDYCAEFDSVWCAECLEPKCSGCGGCRCERGIQPSLCPSCFMTITAYESAHGLHECF